MGRRHAGERPRGRAGRRRVGALAIHLVEFEALAGFLHKDKMLEELARMRPHDESPKTLRAMAAKGELEALVASWDGEGEPPVAMVADVQVPGELAVRPGSRSFLVAVVEIRAASTCRRARYRTDSTGTPVTGL